MEAASTGAAFGPLDWLRLGREVLRAEGAALLRLAAGLGRPYCRAVELLYDCRGNVIVSGMGKAGLVGQKIAATLASTGTRAHFLHPAEAVHGDLGRVGGDDAALILSQSGETEEVVRLLAPLAALGVPIVAVTARPDSSLGRAAAVVLELGPLAEACPLGLAPSTSTTAMLALGDALALTLSRRRNFRAEDFARLHPGGALGRKLSKVEEVMRPLAECRVADQQRTVREVLIAVSRPGRRSGAVMLVDAEGRLTGLFTDSDLARLFETGRDGALDRPIREVMTPAPTRVVAGVGLPVAVELLAMRKFSELPVVDASGAPVGMIDITDVVGMLPPQAAAEGGGAARAAPPAEGAQGAAPLAGPHSSRRPAKSLPGDAPATLPFANFPPAGPRTKNIPEH